MNDRTPTTRRTLARVLIAATGMAASAALATVVPASTLAATAVEYALL